jgi:tetratricopeptide (TPR) repeat protein
LIGLLIIFAQQRKHDLFKTVLEEGDLKDSIKELPEILNDLAPHLLTGDDLQNNLSFIFECLDESENMDLEIVINLQLLFLRESTNATKRQAILLFLERKLQRSEKIGSNKSIATHLYNLGQFHRGIGDLSKALYYYNKARKKYEFYLKMDYFLKELGGLLFDSKKYNMSCFFYKKAWEKDNSNPLIHAAYGDALLFNGMYLAAKEKYDYFLLNANDNFDKHEWHVKFACLTTLLENHYPLEQKREELKALELASPENLKHGEIFYEKLEMAIELDLLCSLAWYNAGLDDVKNGKLLNGFIAFLMSGLINRWNIYSWLNATIIGFQIEEASKLLYHIVNAAHFYC